MITFRQTSLVALILALLAGCAPAATPAPTTAPAGSLTAAPITIAPTPVSGLETRPYTPAPAATPAVPAGFEELATYARQFVLLMAEKGDFDSATARFDPTMKTALPAAKLKETWQQVTTQMGAYKEVSGTRTAEAQGYRLVFVTAAFANGLIDIRVVFDAQGRVAGLFFQPAQAGAPTPAATAAPGAACRESKVTVGSGEWALPGTLCVPNGSGPFPGVVFLHGSGPSDRDETIGPNKVFQDLARGLAEKGVASLRFDKRTYAHKAKFTPEMANSITLKEETIEDALLALQALRASPAVDPRRIYIVGHSLGAMAAPRIGQLEPGLAGLVLLAGTPRPLEDLVVEQVTYLYSLNGGPTEPQKAEIEKLKQQAALVKSPALSPTTPAKDLPLEAPAAYWLYLKAYDILKTAQELQMPMLILNGGRDYQVTSKDFEAWKNGLAAKTNVTFKFYPALNHLFIAGEGPASPEDYNKAGHVSPEVIADIAAWIKSN